jgi:hypothetical protein
VAVVKVYCGNFGNSAQMAYTQHDVSKKKKEDFSRFFQKDTKTTFLKCVTFSKQMGKKGNEDK